MVPARNNDQVKTIEQRECKDVEMMLQLANDNDVVAIAPTTREQC